MCGIVAIVNVNQEPGSDRIAEAMSERIAHRGPDGMGHWAHDNVALGHRRLSIIDLSDGGSQPMQTPDGRYTIAYNGELYNFADIKLELKALGEHFVSRSDTEVLLRAIARFGLENAVKRFNGIFAFVCYDAKERRLLVGRDRYGIKPLYWCRTRTSFLFASEPKAFLGHPDYAMAIDPEGMAEYFTFQNFLTDRTIFKGVRMVPAGHIASLDCTRDGPFATSEYWDFRFDEPANPKPHKDLKRELLFLFEQAVSRQLVSDVDVSCYLSGGMDSGSITAVAARILPKLTTFTCGFDLTSASGAELHFDERRLAEHMSYLFGTEHYEVVLKAGDMERAIPRLVHHLDEPRVGQSYPNFYVAGLASRFGKVVLGGTGGDELFGGYPWRYYRAAHAHNTDEFVNSYFPFWQRLLPRDRLAATLAPLGLEAGQVDVEEVFRSVLARHPVDFSDPSASLNLALYFEAKTFLHGLLVVEDKLSMAHGLESRVPFLDNDLVDFAMRIPAREKVGNLHMVREMNLRNKELGTESVRQFQKTNDGKLLLRKMMSELLPASIIDAQKQGFSAPDASWFRGESIDFVRSSIGGDHAPVYRFLAHDEVHPLLQEHFDGKENHRLLLWSVLCVNELIKQNNLAA
ncbi:MAG: asparagine synthase (glutamine-hydrolyzing) [Rhizobiaceae bacterium]